MKSFLLCCFLFSICDKASAETPAVGPIVGYYIAPNGEALIFDTVRLKTTLPSIRVFEKLQNDASEQIIKAIDDAIKSIKDERVAIENMRALDLLFKKRLASLDEKRKVVNFGLALDFTIQALRFNIQAAENKAKYEESKK